MTNHAKTKVKRAAAAGLVAFVLIAPAPPSIAPMASAMPAGGHLSVLAGLFAPSLIVYANVICARERSGDQIITWSCPDGKTCINVGGAWKCRGPVADPMACSVCYSNYDRDKRGCDAGTLQQQVACVNGALATWKQCLAHCS
jgi:hypothetical protein